MADGSRQIACSDSSSESDIRDDGIHHFTRGGMMRRIVIVHGSTAVAEGCCAGRRVAGAALVSGWVCVLSVKRRLLVQLTRAWVHSRVGILSL